MIDDIGLEGKALSNIVQDISNYRYKYIIEHMSFDALKISVFEDYYQYLKANSDFIPLNAKYYYKPDYLSFDQYQTTKLYELLMFINNCACLEEFTMNYVFIPSFDSIFELMSHTIPESKRIRYLTQLNLS